MTICSPDDTEVGRLPGAPGTLHLAAEDHAVNEGRRWVCDQVRAMGASDDAMAVIELLASELLTNAVKYGPRTGSITVLAERHGHLVDIAITDDGDEVPVLRAPGPEDLGGRGLLLVEALADQWGVELLGTRGKAVWFHLTLAA